MRPTTAIKDNVFDINALLHPGTVFNHPRDVVSHPTLTLAEKRAILASWASDASAIASCPALRAPNGLKAPVTIDEIRQGPHDATRTVHRLIAVLDRDEVVHALDRMNRRRILRLVE
jgi:hypothetical protein